MKSDFTKAAVLVCSILACLPIVKGWTEEYCRDNNYECPGYDVLEKNETGDYELRRYSQSNWARTSVSDVTYSSLSPAYDKLDEYFNKKNKEEIMIQETAPAAVITEGGKHFVSFFVPNDLKAPTPTDDSIEVKSVAVVEMYVRVFSKGMPKQSNWESTWNELKASLDSAGKKYDSNRWLALAYEGFTPWTNRHDEVWIPKASD